MHKKKELTEEELEELLMQQQEAAKCNMKPAHKYIKLKFTSKDN
ncbi:MAG TPA: hypothetical protein VMW53_08410 [archaeon]|nr:hypothetical protein [archaeon]